MSKILLEYGADPNSCADHNATPLYSAIRHGKPELAKLLLKFGANPHLKKARKEISTLAGMKKIEKYFGAPWNDIVRRIQDGEDLEGGQGRKRI